MKNNGERKNKLAVFGLCKNTERRTFVLFLVTQNSMKQHPTLLKTGFMGGGAWPFLVGGVICLVNSVNERDLLGYLGFRFRF